MNVDELLELPLYGLKQQDKDALLTSALSLLTAHHRVTCAAYARLADVLHHPRAIERLAEVPWLPVGLFKSHRLTSIPDDKITTILTSSGTTGQVPSRIYLDQETAGRQTRALARIMTHVLGPRRLPMIVIDTKQLLSDRGMFSARGAGVLGMMNFGARPLFALDADMTLDRAGLDTFLAKHADAPFLVFGFTYMVWAYLYEQIKDAGLDLRNGILIHSGGWKRLGELAVDNATFKSRLAAATGLHRVYNFYGMVEQVGSVFLEGDDGLLYPPMFADVIVRDPETLAEAPVGVTGVLQTLSVLPTSYPGHSLLTEDLGVIEHIDRGDRMGKAFRVLGRAPLSELRGCSDTHVRETAS